MDDQQPLDWEEALKMCGDSELLRSTLKMLYSEFLDEYLIRLHAAVMDINLLGILQSSITMKDAVSVAGGKRLEHHLKILEEMVRPFLGPHFNSGKKMAFTKEDEIKILSYYASYIPKETREYKLAIKKALSLRENVDDINKCEKEAYDFYKSRANTPVCECNIF